MYFADIVCCICCSVCFCLRHGGSGYEDCSYCVGYFRLLFCRSVPIIQRDSSKTYRFVNDSVAFVYIVFRIIKKHSPIHLTTSKAMVIVWRLKVNIIRTVSCCQRATSSVSTVKKQFIQLDWASSLSFYVRLHDLSVYYLVCFVSPWTDE